LSAHGGKLSTPAQAEIQAGSRFHGDERSWCDDP